MSRNFNLIVHGSMAAQILCRIIRSPKFSLEMGREGSEFSGADRYPRRVVFDYPRRLASSVGVTSCLGVWRSHEEITIDECASPREVDSSSKRSISHHPQG